MIAADLFTQPVILTLMFAMLRVVGLLVSLPLFGTKLVPVMVKVILAFILTLFAYPVIVENFTIQTEYTWINMVVIGAAQFLLGVLMGFLIQILFQAFILAGQIIAMQMGLGFASMNDPTSGMAVPTVGQIYNLMVTLMYFAVDGHMFVFSALTESFSVVPIGIEAYSALNFNHVFASISWMFASSLKIVLPAIVALLLVNMSLGIMTKAAPQLNIFSIGFPMTMILGMIILYLTLLFITPHFERMTERVHSHVVEVANGT